MQAGERNTTGGRARGPGGREGRKCCLRRHAGNNTKLQIVINETGDKEIQADTIVKMAENLINKDNFDEDVVDADE